jgi:hypothetical protein
VSLTDKILTRFLPHVHRSHDEEVDAFRKLAAKLRAQAPFIGCMSDSAKALVDGLFHERAALEDKLKSFVYRMQTILSEMQHCLRAFVSLLDDICLCFNIAMCVAGSPYGHTGSPLTIISSKRRSTWC